MCVGCQCRIRARGLFHESGMPNWINAELDKITKSQKVMESCVLCIVDSRQRSATNVRNEILSPFLVFFRTKNTCLCWHIKQWVEKRFRFKASKRIEKSEEFVKLFSGERRHKTFRKSSIATHGPAGELHRSQVLQTAHILRCTATYSYLSNASLLFAQPNTRSARERVGERKKRRQQDSDCRHTRIKWMPLKLKRASFYFEVSKHS